MDVFRDSLSCCSYNERIFTLYNTIPIWMHFLTINNIFPMNVSLYYVILFLYNVYEHLTAILSHVAYMCVCYTYIQRLVFGVIHIYRDSCLV